MKRTVTWPLSRSSRPVSGARWGAWTRKTERDEEVVATVLGTRAMVRLVLAREAPCGRAGPRQHQRTCAAHGAHEVRQEDACVATERRVLAALFEAGKRELP
jgi:hypothetical protein